MQLNNGWSLHNAQLCGTQFASGSMAEGASYSPKEEGKGRNHLFSQTTPQESAAQPLLAQSLAVTNRSPRTSDVKDPCFYASKENGSIEIKPTRKKTKKLLSSVGIDQKTSENAQESDDSNVDNENDDDATQFEEDHDASTTKRKDVRPPFSYIALITMALKSADNHLMTLNNIYKYIMDKFPYFRNNLSRWQNSIRHNLSLNDCFVRVAKQPGQSGKGNFWTLHPKCGNMFSNGSFLRRPKRFRAPKAKPEQAEVQHVNSFNHFSLYGPGNTVAPNYNHIAYCQQAPYSTGYPAFNAMGGYGPTVAQLQAPMQQTAACDSAWPIHNTTACGRTTGGYHYGLTSASPYHAMSSGTFPAPHTGYVRDMAASVSGTHMAPALSSAYPTFQAPPAYPMGVNGSCSMFSCQQSIQQH